MADPNFCYYCQFPINACNCTHEDVQRHQEQENYEYEQNVARLKRQGFEFDPMDKALVKVLTPYALSNERPKVIYHNPCTTCANLYDDPKYCAGHPENENE